MLPSTATPALPRRRFLRDLGRCLGAGGIITASSFPNLALGQTAAASVTVPTAPAGDIESLEHLGEFIRECTLPGETRRDDVVPRHANCIQVARARWLVIYSTHGYRGVDDERSIIYQLRRDAPDGAVIKEGFLARSAANWLPAGVPPPPAGKAYFKQHGHMVAFGVPKGAVIGGQPARSANLFVAQWRVLGRVLDVQRDFLDKTYADMALFRATQGVEQIQFRLNDRDDDLEILQPATRLRQKGFATGAAFCSADAEWMNQTFCPAVPVNAERTEWAECNHFDRGRIAALKHQFNPASGRYEWTALGPFLGEARKPLSEASLVRLADGWLVAARGSGQITWARATDPFTAWSDLTLTKEPAVSAPLTAFRCGDGIVRLFTGDKVASPQRYDRDPLYCWDVQPDRDFAVSQRREIYSSTASRPPFRLTARPKIDFCELFPHHGRTQLIVHGVSTRAFNHPYDGQPGIPILNAAEKSTSGLYVARLTYRTAPPPLWNFA